MTTLGSNMRPLKTQCLSTGLDLSEYCCPFQHMFRTAARSFRCGFSRPEITLSELKWLELV